MGISDDRKERRRKEILKAATALFVKKGFDGTSFNEIAVRSKASKETLYAWFGDKGGILAEILKERFGGIVRTITNEIGSGKPDQAIYLFARELLRASVDPTVAALFSATTSSAMKHPEVRALFAGRENENNDPLVNYLELCRAMGWMKFDDARKAAMILGGMARGEYPIWLATGRIKSVSDEEIEHHARVVAQMFLKAVAPDKPETRSGEEEGAPRPNAHRE